MVLTTPNGVVMNSSKFAHILDNTIEPSREEFALTAKT